MHVLHSNLDELTSEYLLLGIGGEGNNRKKSVKYLHRVVYRIFKII